MLTHLALLFGGLSDSPATPTASFMPSLTIAGHPLVVSQGSLLNDNDRLAQRRPARPRRPTTPATTPATTPPPATPATTPAATPTTEQQANTPAASTTPAATTTPATAATPSTPAANPCASGAPATEPAPAATTETPAATDSASSSEPEEEEVNIDQLRIRAALTRTHRALGISTVALLGAANIFGTMAIFNEVAAPDASGRYTVTQWCTSNAFCTSLGSLHRTFVFTSMATYAVTGAFGLAMPDPERVTAQNDGRATRLRVHKILAWTHVTGMVLQPILGILGTRGGDVFLSGATNNDRLGFRFAMMTAHEVVGWVTFAALTGAMITELIP